MFDYQKKFIEFAIAEDVLKFGEFTLKSGRTSPYFFNAGLFQTGASLYNLSAFYADAIVNSGISFDGLFGPAYKGIPLVSSVAMQLHAKYQLNYPYSYNRKEAKTHGEGGMIVGAPLSGRILVIDDVITAGTAIREATQIINQADNAELAGVVVSLDRQEKGQGERSAIQEVEEDLQVPVVSIVGLEHVIDYAHSISFNKEMLAHIEAYRKEYGVA